jgi:hypothetical protein
MAASFGVTGGLRNPYLLNINTDKEWMDGVHHHYDKEIGDHEKVLEKFNKEMVTKADELKRKQTETLEKYKKDRERIASLEKELDAHEQNTTHELAEQDALTAYNEAQTKLDLAKEAHSKHKKEKERLKQLLDKEHNDIVKRSHTSTAKTRTFNNHTRSTNPHNYTEVDNKGTGNSTRGKGGFSIGKIRKLFTGMSSNAANELDFHDIARLSASRENRCMYL